MKLYRISYTDPKNVTDSATRVFVDSKKAAGAKRKELNHGGIPRANIVTDEVVFSTKKVDLVKFLNENG